MNKKFNYVYLITNLINGKQYVGDHSTDNLDDEYLGSGKYLNYVIKKQGRNNFKKEILEHFKTKQEAFSAQEKYIIQFNTLKPNGYNLSPQGGFKCAGMHSLETRKKMSNSHRGLKQTKEIIQNRIDKCALKREEISKKQSNSHKGHIVSEETRIKISNSNKGKKKSKEHIKNISISHKGHIVSEETKEKLRRPRSEESKLKQSITNKGSKRSEETKLKMSISAKNRKKQ